MSGTLFESRATNLDRIVYAENESTQIVRYDRAGHWYAEWSNGKRRRLTLQRAVDAAFQVEQDGGQIYVRQMGGLMFDARVRRRRGE